MGFGECTPLTLFYKYENWGLEKKIIHQRHRSLLLSQNLFIYSEKLALVTLSCDLFTSVGYLAFGTLDRFLFLLELLPAPSLILASLDFFQNVGPCKLNQFFMAKWIVGHQWRYVVEGSPWSPLVVDIRSTVRVTWKVLRYVVPLVFLITDGLEAFGTLGSSFQALGGEEQHVSCVHVSSRVLSLCLK